MGFLQLLPPGALDLISLSRQLGFLIFCASLSLTQDWLPLPLQKPRLAFEVSQAGQ